ncbi:GntR family transcriptional regulator [Phytoactinopolyspora alkaliphila]|uniref:GntR family transcriptional regulator n=1 Tax=Phytoactinopolyspora alkaliphila TaxID=1783498 RepID=A0A6N9YMN3_9ACTN|nr:GntR family transcriptional regulator [Phytoactinopolyspora alkaliphila]NED96286.1 GntR family transcriptional regulator [Phytoactinopolyspora alkaliphila]
MASLTTGGTRGPQFDVLPRTKLRDEATQQIKAQIVAGKLEPGVLYSVSTIAEQLQVSATPIREAVLDLAKDGLVEMVRNRGFRVRVLTDKDLDDLVELRLVLEVPAMGKLATIRPRPDLSQLRPMAKAIIKHAADGDMVAFVARDRDFHLGLTALLGNQRYVDMVAMLRDQTRLVGLSQLRGAAKLIDSAREHEELLDLIEAGDVAGTEDLMTRHLRHARGLWAGRPEPTHHV